MHDVDRYLRMVIPANMLLDLMFFSKIGLEKCNAYVGGYYGIGVTLTIHPYFGGTYKNTANVYAGGFVISASKVTLNPNIYEKPVHTPWSWQPGRLEK